MAVAAGWGVLFTVWALWMWFAVRVAGVVAGEPVLVGGLPALIGLFLLGAGAGVAAGNVIVVYAGDAGLPIRPVRALVWLAGASPLAFLVWLLLTHA